jgi:putative FmdB family regulatory protein
VRHEKEYLQKVSDPLITVCPSCGESAMKKLISAAGFQLKGSGWYATDFKNGGGKSAAAASSGAAAAESKPADSKPAESASSGGACSSGPCPACT